jgi:uncharacterized protein
MKKKEISCKQCGICCRTLIVSDNVDEIIQLRQGFKGKLKFKGETYYILDVPCIYLTRDNKCSIYDKRPELCSKFPGPAFSEFWKIINPKCGMLNEK